RAGPPRFHATAPVRAASLDRQAPPARAELRSLVSRAESPREPAPGTLRAWLGSPRSRTNRVVAVRVGSQDRSSTATSTAPLYKLLWRRGVTWSAFPLECWRLIQNVTLDRSFSKG